MTGCWDLMEFLLTSAEKPIIMIDEEMKPVYQENVSIYEKIRSEYYEFISRGEVEFSELLFSLFGDSIKFTKEFVVKAVNFFILNLSKQDRQKFTRVFAATDVDHQEYKPVFEFM